TSDSVAAVRPDRATRPRVARTALAPPRIANIVEGGPSTSNDSPGIGRSATWAATIPTIARNRAVSRATSRPGAGDVVVPGAGCASVVVMRSILVGRPPRVVRPRSDPSSAQGWTRAAGAVTPAGDSAGQGAAISEPQQGEHDERERRQHEQPERDGVERPVVPQQRDELPQQRARQVVPG